MDSREKKKLENKIKVLKMKLKMIKDDSEFKQKFAYKTGFEQGFDEGIAYQINAFELELFEPHGDAN